MAYDLAIFDLDGTLSDSVSAITGSVAKTLEEMHYPPLSDADLLRFVGPPLLETFPGICGMDESDANRAVEVYRRHYYPMMQQIPLFDGVKEMLTRLQKAGVRMAVVSAKLDYLVKESLEYAGISDYFEIKAGLLNDMGESSLEAGVHSCKSAVLAQVLADLYETKPFASAVMVGDRSNDYWAATDNSIPAIGVSWGAGSSSEFPDSRWVTSIDELYQAITS